jgi:hypothetical protein
MSATQVDGTSSVHAQRVEVRKSRDALTLVSTMTLLASCSTRGECQWVGLCTRTGLRGTCLLRARARGRLQKLLALQHPL